MNAVIACSFENRNFVYSLRHRAYKNNVQCYKQKSSTMDRKKRRLIMELID